MFGHFMNKMLRFKFLWRKTNNRIYKNGWKDGYIEKSHIHHLQAGNLGKPGSGMTQSRSKEV